MRPDLSPLIFALATCLLLGCTHTPPAPTPRPRMGLTAKATVTVTPPACDKR